MADFSQAREAIENCEGGILWNELQDLQDILWVFEQSVSDLIDSISLFDERTKYAKFWDDSIDSDRDKHSRVVKMRIFQSTIALMALVDHSRNFSKKYPVIGYEDHIKHCFGRDGLHDFLKCLRNYNSHLRLTSPEWRIQHDLKTKARRASFLIKKTDLMRWGKWSEEAKKYLEKSPDKLDIYDLFFSYRS